MINTYRRSPKSWQRQGQGIEPQSPDGKSRFSTLNPAPSLARGQSAVSGWVEGDWVRRSGHWKRTGDDEGVSED